MNFVHTKKRALFKLKFLRHVVFNRALLAPWIIKILHRFGEENYHIYVMTLDILFHFQEQAVNPYLIPVKRYCFSCFIDKKSN